MQKQVLSIFLILIMLCGSAQQWTKNLPQDKLQNGELSFYEIEQAFTDYWGPLKVDGGYYLKNGEKVKAPGWKQFKRWAWKMESIIDSEGNFPETSTVEEMEKYYQMYPDAGKSLSGNWTNIGYNTSNGGYQGIGRINCIAFHPSNNNILWVGAPSGGLWITTNGGSSWSVLTDANTVMGVSAIAITSNYATSQTLYIGTGDRDGGSAWALGGGNNHDNEGVGVLKSVNGGATWTSSLSFNPSQKIVVYDLLINPSNNNNLIAATGNGIYETTNAGFSWSQITTNICTDLEYRPGSTSVFYGAFINGKHFMTFTKSGTWGWTSYTLPGSSSYRTEIAVSANNSNVIYAVTVNSGSGLEGIYKSTNAGTSFSLIYDGSVSGNNLLGYECNGTTFTGQGFYDVFITANPSNANEVFLGGINVWKSTDGGISWTPKTHWSGTCGGTATTMHADQHCCEYQSSSTLFIGNDGGIYKSTNNGNNWTDMSNGLTINQIYRIGVSQSHINEIITGLQDNGTHTYTGSGWVANAVIGGDGMECLINPNDHNNQFGEYIKGDIRRTTNHWSTQTNVRDTIRTAAGNATLAGAWVTPYTLDPNNPNTLFVAYDEVWKSTDQGATSGNFSSISSFSTSGTIRSLKVAPSNSNYIYAGFLTTLYKTTDGGSNWTNVTSGLPVSNGNITYLNVKNNDPQTVWVTIGGFNSNAVYETTNGGTTWTNISTGLPQLPAMSIVQNIKNTSKVELYVAMTQGVWMKTGSANWVPFKNGLPNVFCTELEIYYDNNTPSNSKIRVGTYGRGLWETPLPAVDFAANNTMPSNSMTTVSLTDLSTNSPSGWFWSISPSTVTFVGGTGANSQNPQVVFNNPGAYTVSLTTTNTYGNNSETKTSYIHMGTPGLWTGNTSNSWSTGTNWHNHMLPTSSIGVTVNPGALNWPVYIGNLEIGTQCGTLTLNGNAVITVQGDLKIPAGKSVYCSMNATLNVEGDFINYGAFTPGTSVVKMTGNSNAEINGNISSNGNQSTTYNTNYQYPGGYFDVVASGGNNISVNSFEIHCASSGTVNIEVWYKSGTYVGFTSNSGAWTQLGTTQTLTGQGFWNPTTVNTGASVTIPAGSTYAFFINCYSGSAGYMRLLGISNVYSNADISINTGFMSSGVSVGSGGWSGYTFNGTVYYSYVTSNPISFHDLEINKNNATVSTNGNLTVNNDFIIKPGAWFTNATGNSMLVAGNAMLESTSGGKASFIDNGNFAVAGANTVESYYTDGRWHFISSPVSNALAGIFLNIYLKEWDEANYTWNYISSATQSLGVGTGYEIWSTLGNPTVYYSGGPLNVGNVSPTLTATDSNGGGIGANEGWNLVGNPYPSAIDWGTANNPVSGYVRTNLDNAIYIWTGSQYATYNPSLNGGAGLGTNGGSQTIQSMQSFFIKANNTNPALTIPNGARLHSANANLKSKTDAKYLRLAVDGNGDSDEIIIEVNESASFAFDSEFDAYKLYGSEESPQFYVITSFTELSVYVVPEILIEDIIPLGFKAGIENDYLFNAAQIENFDDFEVIYLEDLATGSLVNLKEEPQYLFTYQPGEDEHRFNLHFTDNPVGSFEPATNDIKVWTSGNSVYVQTLSSGSFEIAVYNLMGQELYPATRSSDNITEIRLDAGNGIYFVQVSTMDYSITRKVFLR